MHRETDLSVVISQEKTCAGIWCDINSSVNRRRAWINVWRWQFGEACSIDWIEHRFAGSIQDYRCTDKWHNAICRGKLLLMCLSAPYPHKQVRQIELQSQLKPNQSNICLLSRLNLRVGPPSQHCNELKMNERGT